MEKPDLSLLVELVKDVKNDVIAMKKDLADTKEMTYANSIVLDEHARRSEASESRLDVQEEKLEKFMEKMEPIQDHVKAIETLKGAGGTTLKVIATILSIAGAVAGFLKFR